MRTIQRLCVAVLLLLANHSVNAQAAAAAEPYYLVVTTMHANLDVKDFSMDEWIATEKEYYNKVVSKNEHILASNVLTHYYTADNTEILFVTLYKNWSGIELAQKRTTELIFSAWADKKARNSYFEKRENYYVTMHSDEIYVTVPGMKELATTPDKPMIYYVRKNEMAYPADGSDEEIEMLVNQYVNEVTRKNPMIKAFYQYVHAWGSNRNDHIEVSVFDSLSDLEKSSDQQDTLFEAYWKDAKSRKEYNDKLARYYTGKHADYIYRSVPGLEKTAAHSPK